MWEINKEVILESLSDIYLEIGNGKAKHKDLEEIKVEVTKILEVIGRKLNKEEMTW